LYPIMPIYLKSIGFSVVLIGILEGVAEATAGLSKGFFGKLSDNLGKRMPFVRLGYSLSAISKPLMGVFMQPLWIFIARTLDRFGKGIRTGARDAILADEATPQSKGKVFGFHSAMDTLGAAIGPMLALVYLYYYPEDYRTLFFIAFFPGVLAVLATFLIKGKKTDSIKQKVSTPFFSFISYWKNSPKQYKKLVYGLIAFTLFNCSNVFLLLRAKETGLNDTAVIGVYIFYNLVYALFAFPLGALADKLGLKKVFILGLVLFAMVYFGMALGSKNLVLFYSLFFLYGIYSAATEGIAKAWISNIVDGKNMATAIGTFSGFQSIATMIASSLAGFIWYKFGATSIFLITAIATLMVIVYILTLPNPSNKKTRTINY
ncbi:MAG TPA: MFS transporter, partial [Flavobacteriia bacterium]|nr:MFS transporter [Flavobacteriia bacterium]